MVLDTQRSYLQMKTILSLYILVVLTTRLSLIFSYTTVTVTTRQYRLLKNSKFQNNFQKRVILQGLDNENDGSDMIETGPDDSYYGGSPCIIKVIGVGGGGGNAVNRMIQTLIEGVSFWAINTDTQALTRSLASNRLHIGRETTRGLGAGGDPKVGEKAAVESLPEIRSMCSGADLIFITAGMGGGTGSGGAPIVADIAKNEIGALTIGVVTKPFGFEGRKRMRQAAESIEKLSKVVDTLIIVSNDKLLRIVPDNTPVTDAFLVADDILRQGVVGISEIIIKSGIVNVDFADVKTVMQNAGTALMGVGTGKGKTRAQDAALAAISSPLLDFPIRKARGVVFNVVGGPDLALSEINAASEVIYENADKDANIIFGALIEEAMGDEVSITVLACGFRDDNNDIDIDIAQQQSKPQTNIYSQLSSTSSTTTNRMQQFQNDIFMDEDLSPNFYKERRQLTKSPLGPSATLEETRRFITTGGRLKRDDSDDDENNNNEEDELSRRGGRFGGFFNRFIRGRKSS